MNGYRPMILVWLAVALGLAMWADAVIERALHRIDEWWTDRRELARLDREDAARREIARLLHPSSQGGRR